MTCQGRSRGRRDDGDGASREDGSDLRDCLIESCTISSIFISSAGFAWIDRVPLERPRSGPSRPNRVLRVADVGDTGCVPRHSFDSTAGNANPRVGRIRRTRRVRTRAESRAASSRRSFLRVRFCGAVRGLRQRRERRLAAGGAPVPAPDRLDVSVPDLERRVHRPAVDARRHESSSGSVSRHHRRFGVRDGKACCESRRSTGVLVTAGTTVRSRSRPRSRRTGFSSPGTATDGFRDAVISPPP